MEMWKTAACADGKPIHSTWKRTGLSHILQTGFPQLRRDRQFTHIPTTPAAAGIHPVLSYLVWDKKRKSTFLILLGNSAFATVSHPTRNSEL